VKPLKLFNVDHEGWEDVDTRDTTPPDGALEFEVEAAAWISTKEGLDLSIAEGGQWRHTEGADESDRLAGTLGSRLFERHAGEDGDSR
jgi:hypothetical protein